VAGGDSALIEFALSRETSGQIGSEARPRLGHESRFRISFAPVYMAPGASRGGLPVVVRRDGGLGAFFPWPVRIRVSEIMTTPVPAPVRVAFADFHLAIEAARCAGWDEHAAHDAVACMLASGVSPYKIVLLFIDAKRRVQ
jgi:hypothetical protein